MTRLLVIVALCGVVGTGGGYTLGRWQGYAYGVADQKEKHEAARVATQRTLFDLGEENRRLADALAAREIERKKLAEDLEAAALAADGATDGGIDADGVRRLQRRWGSP